MDKEVQKIKVSNEFVDIYTNFNVVTQVENMKKLSKREVFSCKCHVPSKQRKL